MNVTRAYKNLTHPKKIAIGTLKGGTGKTTLAYNMSGYLGCNLKVLLIDADPQGNASRNCGIETFDPDLKCIKNIFIGEDPDPEDIILHGLIQDETDPDNMLETNLDLLPSSIYLDMADFQLNKIAFTEDMAAAMSVLRDYLERHADYFNQYDFIIFDTNPSMSFTNRNAFFAADEIFLISDPDTNSGAGIQAFTTLWKYSLNLAGFDQRQHNISAIILNKLKSTRNISKDFVTFMKENPDYGDLVLENVIQDREAFGWSTIYKKPVFCLTEYKNKTSIRDAAMSIAAVINELDERNLL